VDYILTSTFTLDQPPLKIG